MSSEHETNAPQTAPSDTASPGFHLPDTLDWSSQLAQFKNRLLLVPHSVSHLTMDAPAQQEGTSDSR